MFDLNKSKTKKILIRTTIFLLLAFVLITPIFIFADQPANTKTGVDTVDTTDSSNPVVTTLIELLGIDKIVSTIAQMALWLCSLLLSLVGLIFEQSVKYGIQNFSALAGNVSMVSVGWVVARDISNIVFIFLVLWVGLSTILGLHHGSTMGSIMKIVVAALLINFSLFITKAVIDVANVIALHFYDLITDGGDGTLSGVFMQGLRMQGIYDPEGFRTLGLTKIIMIGAFGSVMILVACWVFIAGSILMVYRTLSLVILMITSPFAFIAWVVPHMGNYTHDWWHKLFHQAFFAPIFMGMAYIVGKIIQSENSLVGITVNKTVSQSLEIISSGAGTDTGTLLGAVGVFFNFVIIIGLMIACLHIAEHSAGEGATTAMHWAEHARGMATGFIGRNAVRYGGIRALNEKFSESKFGNTGLGKKVRLMTTGYLAEKATFGGHHTAEEVHKEALEERARREEIHHEEEAEHLAQTRTTVEQTQNAEVQKAKDKALSAKDEVKRLQNTGASTVDIDKAKEELKKAQKEVKKAQSNKSKALEKADGDIQRILVKLSPKAFSHMAKKTLFNEVIMRNASQAQISAVQGGDRLTDEEKDKSLQARYAHVKDAFGRLKGPMEEFEKKQGEYIEGMAKVFEEAEKVLGRKINIDDEVDVKLAIDTAKKAGIAIPEEPKKPSIRDVDPTVRNWLRAMSPKEMDWIYKVHPEELAQDPEFCSTVRQGAIDYARNSENIASVDRDKMRERKSQIVGDGEVLAAGLGVNKPSIETMKKIYVDLGLVDSAKASTKEFKDFLQNMTEEEWEKEKSTTIRSAVGEKMEDGSYAEYIQNMNAEQKALRKIGLGYIQEGISGKTQEEVAKMRGYMWQNSDASRFFDRGITRKFGDKDIGEIKILMNHFLGAMEDQVKFMATSGKEGRQMSKENFDTLIWIMNEKEGKMFKQEGAIAPELRKIFEDLESKLVGVKSSAFNDPAELDTALQDLVTRMNTPTASGAKRKRYSDE